MNIIQLIDKCEELRPYEAHRLLENRSVAFYHTLEEIEPEYRSKDYDIIIVHRKVFIFNKSELKKAQRELNIKRAKKAGLYSLLVQLLVLTILYLFQV